MVARLLATCIVRRRSHRRTASLGPTSGIVCAAVAAAVLLPAAPVRAQSDEVETLNRATARLSTFSLPAEARAQPGFGDARAVVVVPGAISAGFLLSGMRGRGVLVARDNDDLWRNPALVRLSGVGIGLQGGWKALDIVVVFTDERSVERLLDGKFKVTVRSVASAVAPGGERQASRFLDLGSSTYGVVTAESGLFLGALLEGASLRVDRRGNARLYDAADTTALEASSAATPPPALELLAVLAASLGGGRGAP